MAIYNEVAQMDASFILRKFKQAAEMETAVIYGIKAKGKCQIGGSASISEDSIMSPVDSNKSCTFT